MADARLAHSASCCKSEAHRGLQRQGRGRRTGEMFMQRWVEIGLSKRVCQGAMLVCGIQEQPGREGPMYRMGSRPL
jgi:hypothetical protein